MLSIDLVHKKDRTQNKHALSAPARVSDAVRVIDA